MPSWHVIYGVYVPSWHVIYGVYFLFSLVYFDLENTLDVFL